MKITIITSNKNRHNYFINELNKISSELFVIQECREMISLPENTKNKINIKKYFNKVQKADEFFFKPCFISSKKKINILSLKFGDIKNIKLNKFDKFFKSNIYIVFGSSFLKGKLLNFLIRKKAINIHMGISPYYRGADCNYWALKDKNFHLVGATIHKLSKDLDGGDIIKYVNPTYNPDPFIFTMSVVKNSIDEIVRLIRSKKIDKIQTKKQNLLKQIRCTKKKDFYRENLKDIFKLKIMKKLFFQKKFGDL